MLQKYWTLFADTFQISPEIPRWSPGCHMYTNPDYNYKPMCFRQSPHISLSTSSKKARAIFQLILLRTRLMARLNITQTEPHAGELKQAIYWSENPSEPPSPANIGVSNTSLGDNFDSPIGATKQVPDTTGLPY